MTQGEGAQIAVRLHQSETRGHEPNIIYDKLHTKQHLKGGMQPISRNAWINPISGLGRVTSPNLGLIFGFACYSARLGLVRSPEINPRKSLVKSTAGQFLSQFDPRTEWQIWFYLRFRV